MNVFKNIIFFDGNCMLCNSFIAYLVKKKHSPFLFCDINGSRAGQILANYKLPYTPANTIYFLVNDQLFYKSTAVLKIIGQLNPFYKIISDILLLIPTGIRDFCYSLIANNRFRFFNKTTCYIPKAEQKEKFLYNE